MFPLNPICFNIVSITKLNKVAERGFPSLTPHSTINSSVKSLFILTHALVCIKVRAINLIGSHGGVVVKTLRYKLAGRGFDSRWCHWNFSVT